MTVSTGGPRGAFAAARARRRSPRELSIGRADKTLNRVMIIITAIFALSILYPLIFIASASVSDPRQVNSGRVYLWPRGFSLDAYRTIADYPTIVRGFINSVLYAAGVMLLGCALTMMGGYALSRRDLPGRRFFTILAVITMMFSGGMIPNYLLMKNLHLLNTPWVMIVPSALSVWNLIVTRTYFEVTLPAELLESSQIDGCSDLRFFITIALPLARPILAVNALLYAVGSWNAYFNGLIYLTDPNLYPLQLVMRNIMTQNTYDPTVLQNLDPEQLTRLRLLADKLKYALIVVASIPPLIAYPLVQKHFVKGMMIGSVKG